MDAPCHRSSSSGSSRPSPPSPPPPSPSPPRAPRPAACGAASSTRTASLSKPRWSPSSTTRTGATSTVFSVADGRYTLRGQRPGGPYRVTAGAHRISGLHPGRHRTAPGTVRGRRNHPRVGGHRSRTAHCPGGAGSGVQSGADRNLHARHLRGAGRTAHPDPQLPRLRGALPAGPRLRGGRVGGRRQLPLQQPHIDGALNQDVFGLSTNNIAGGGAGPGSFRSRPSSSFRWRWPLRHPPVGVHRRRPERGHQVGDQRVRDLGLRLLSRQRTGRRTGDRRRLDRARAVHRAGGIHRQRPIRRDQAHFFIAGEWERVSEPPSGFHVGESDPFRLSLVPDSVARMRSLLQQLGADPGTASSFSLENQLANLFARVDWKLGDRHDAMLRYSFAAADDEPDPNRLPGAPTSSRRAAARSGPATTPRWSGWCRRSATASRTSLRPMCSS